MRPSNGKKERVANVNVVEELAQHGCWKLFRWKQIDLKFNVFAFRDINEINRREFLLSLMLVMNVQINCEEYFFWKNKLDS